MAAETREDRDRWCRSFYPQVVGILQRVYPGATVQVASRWDDMTRGVDLWVLLPDGKLGVGVRGRRTPPTWLDILLRRTELPKILQGRVDLGFFFWADHTDRLDSYVLVDWRLGREVLLREWPTVRGTEAVAVDIVALLKAVVTCDLPVGDGLAICR